MNYIELKKKITEVNNYLKTYKWMDFCVSNANNGLLKIAGNTDFSWNKDCIHLTFKEVTLIHIVLYDWMLCEKGDFIEISTGEEVKKAIGVQPTKNYFVFKINVEGEMPIWIFAKQFDYEIFEKS